MKKLTPMQERFVEEYLVDLNAGKAALRAGYKERSHRRMATYTLKHPLVKKAIKKARDKLSEKIEITQEQVIGGLKKIAFGKEKASDRNKALELLGKYLGMFVDKHEHTGKDGKELMPNKITIVYE